ncbi:MAG: hypothetical protein ACR2IE_08600 [Candidatus Sumerlaeaceae bacterium]
MGKTELSLEALTKQSDEIVIGKVKSKSTHVVGRHIETDYEVDVVESLKGTSRVGSQVEMTVIGGALTSPPLTQFVEAQPLMIRGEDVALFLRTSPPKLTKHQTSRLSEVDAKSKLLRTPRVVGMNQGKFSIITDKQGRRKVTKINLEERGIMPEDTVLSKTLSAIGSGRIRTTARPVVPASAPSTSTDDKRDPLERTNTDAKKLKRGLNSEQTLHSVDSSGPIPVQDFDEFRQQIKSFTQQP